VRAPFASRYLWIYALGAAAIAFIAAYRAGLYLLPVSAWGVALALAVMGMLTPFVVAGSLRRRLLADKWPLVLLVPLFGLVLTPRLLPSPLTVGPFFFCAGALVTTSSLALCNASRRRRLLRRILEEPDPAHSQARSFVQAYFAVGSSSRSSNDARALLRALRAQAWISTGKRRARAASLLREAAESIELRKQIDFPLRALEDLAEACAGTPQRIRDGYLSAAAKLESGGRIFRWRIWLFSLLAPTVDAERDFVAAIELLARRHNIKPPRSFRTYRRTLGRAPFTPRDVASPWTVTQPLVRPVSVGIATLLLAGTLLSTATAKTPLKDTQPLPITSDPRHGSHIEPRLSRALSSLAGHKAEAACWSAEDWRRLSAQRTSWPHHLRRLGKWSAYAAGDRAHLSPALCAWLAHFTYDRIPIGDDSWPAALAFSVAVLAHEAQHLRGISNEAKAECYGMQLITAATRALGRRAAEGRYLAALYWREAYHDHRDPAYVSTECRDGGQLDLHPMQTIWP
jgi:hypothetical protein